MAIYCTLAATAASRRSGAVSRPELTAGQASTQDPDDGGGAGQHQISRIRLIAPPDPPIAPHPLYGKQDLYERGGRVVRPQTALGVNLLSVVTMAWPAHCATFTSPRPSVVGLPIPSWWTIRTA